MTVKLRDLEIVCKNINRHAGTALEPYSRDAEGKTKANLGCYYISSAYGGHKLEQICSSGGGCRDVLKIGFVSKRELYQAMQSFLIGMEVQS